jgi:hypothetical protein
MAFLKIQYPDSNAAGNLCGTGLDYARTRLAQSALLRKNSHSLNLSALRHTSAKIRDMKLAAILMCFAAVAAHAQPKVGEVTTDEVTVQASARSTNPTGGAVVMSGSAVSASGRAATLKLDRGGSVHICPRTTVTASTSSSGRELMVAVDFGTLELDYELGASGDSVVTPDLRLSVAGPSSVHLAVDVLKSGDVCVASLERNNAAVLVSELAGEGSYQVRPGQQITFVKGSTAQARTEPGVNCGCPAPAPILRAAANDPTKYPRAVEPQPASAPANPQLMAELPPALAAESVPQRPAADDAVATHTVIEMDAPMVYNGQRPDPPSETLADVKLFRSADDVLLFPPLILPAQQVAVSPIVQAAAKPASDAIPGKTPSHGIFHRFGAFMASLFR